MSSKWDFKFDETDRNMFDGEPFFCVKCENGPFKCRCKNPALENRAVAVERMDLFMKGVRQ